MKVIKVSPEIKAQLEGSYPNGYQLKFIEDANGNWIVGVGVLTNLNFAPIHEELKQLQIIPHNPRRTQKI